ncbi:non-specific lipid transfer protein GPI-anchored 3 [Solanum dulcamara]|uniref:non-specific lipid transfer protein GPI-anchored 3 n=1 Tax=Solanum dulcamara TaxID=45834 RepID=UPI002485CAC1|nr:non-specific lipid transfer protein GPI-anchored 3 [Solanum dulcamara]
MIAAFLASGVGRGSISAMPCVQKLMPCQPALASHTKTPPATCCAPLKEMITNDAQCLCTVFANSDVMRSMNVTQDEALDFAKACGAKPDLSLCKKDLLSVHPKDINCMQISLKFKKKKRKKKAAGSASAPSPTSSETNSSMSRNKTASPPAENTASVTSKFGGFVAVASLMSLVMLLAF